MLDAPQKTSSVLHGKIVHRLHLPCVGTKDRKGGTDQTEQNGRELGDGRKQSLLANSFKFYNDCGFIFTRDSNLESSQEYLLSFPKRLLKLACNAARLGRTVIIRRYSEIPFSQSFDASKTSSTSTEYAMIEVHDMELVRGEVPDLTKSERECEKISTCIQNEDIVNNIWTPPQFWRKERLDFQKMKNSRPIFSLVATVDTVSPIVALDPSNPFALLEVYDPDNTDITCVVVLHGKEALLNHQAIHPLEKLVFRDVVYKPWSVHKMLHGAGDKKSTASMSYNQFIGRVPSHVFVATQADSVSWVNENTISSVAKTRPQLRHRSRSERDEDRIPLLITPINLEVTITGEVCDVKTLSVSFGHSVATVIHYLDILLLNQPTCGHANARVGIVGNRKQQTSSFRCRLYLSHFPMSVALQCSLRRGAIVRAYNVHCLLKGSQFSMNIDNKVVPAYGACLRSTVTLLNHASDAISPTTNDKASELDLQTRCNVDTSLSTQPCEKSDVAESSPPNPGRLNRKGRRRLFIASRKEEHHALMLHSNFISYGFRKAKPTYVKDLYFERVNNWERQNFQRLSGSLVGGGPIAMHVPSAWIVSAFLDTDQGTNHTTNNRLDSGGRSIPPTSKMVKATLRSPYAEFFNHSFSSRVDDEESNIQHSSSSFHLAVEVQKNSSLRSSVLLGLNEIRVQSQHYFENHISSLFHSSATLRDTQQLYQLRKGFNGSIRVPLMKLLDKEIERDKGSDEKNAEAYLVGGFISEVHLPKSFVASMADGVCQIPISINSDNDHASINGFCMAQLDSVMISWLCLGNFIVGNERDRNIEDVSASHFSSFETKSVSLPSIKLNQNGLMSNCTLVTIGGFLFITAIQLHCSDLMLHEMTESASISNNEIDLENISLTVEKCLATNASLLMSTTLDTVMGTLTRCRFHSKVNTDGSHKCCSLTISSFTRKKSGDFETDDSFLQTLDVSVSVSHSTGRLSKLNEIVSTGWPKFNLMRSQKLLASSFWVLGNSGRTCALTFGGSDNFVPGSSCSKSRIMITVPTSSMRLSKLGYTYFFCMHNGLDALFENMQSSDDDVKLCDAFSKDAGVQAFDFLGATTTPSGMLQRRPPRRTILRSDISPYRTIGELSTKQSSVIPLNTLSDLFELIFESIRETTTSQNILNPSLVRRITNSRFLGVSFCQVQCYCTQCFCPLVGPPSISADDPTRIGKRKRKDSFDEPSFWHLPDPNEPLTGTNRIRRLPSVVSTKSTPTLPGHIQASKFRCSKNECAKRMFGVKWECSGVLDDGTGQATMYADGDAALTLLGMSAETIQIIEEGVWSTRDGSIQFMKSIPPPKELREKVIDILATYRGDGHKKPTNVDPLKLLSQPDRASYLLERHCRSSSRPRRPLEYYVRCKPLRNVENAIPHLRHTMIDSFLDESTSESGSTNIHRGQVASYTLPSLKLELVDCGIQWSETFCKTF